MQESGADRIPSVHSMVFSFHSSVRQYAGRVLLLLLAGGLSSCRTASLEPGETLRKAIAVDQTTLQEKGSRGVKTGTPAAPVLYEWNGGSLSGGLAVTIDLSEQKAFITRGGQPVGWTYVASGKSGHGTPTGSYSVSEKVLDKYSDRWGQVVNGRGDVVVSDARSGRDGGGRFVGASMPFWMRFHGPIGMHAGHLPSPGSPASHGCVRLPRGMAEILFGVVEIGTLVSVVP